MRWLCLVILSCLTSSGVSNPLHQVLLPHMDYHMPVIFWGAPGLHMQAVPGTDWGVPRVVIELDTDHACAAAGSFPNKTDCSRFYTCNDIGGKLVGFKFDCPPGLLYNYTIQLCDWPERVECLQGSRETMETMDNKETMDTIDIMETMDTMETMDIMETVDTMDNKDTIDTMDTVETMDTMDAMDTMATMDTIDTVVTIETINLSPKNVAAFATRSAQSADNPVIIDIDAQFECPGAGSFPIPTTCAYYFSCTDIEGQFQATEVECPPDLLFNASSAKCEKANSFSCNLQQAEDICSAASLTEEEKELCNNNAWKHSDQFIRL